MLIIHSETKVTLFLLLVLLSSVIKISFIVILVPSPSNQSRSCRIYVPTVLSVKVYVVSQKTSYTKLVPSQRLMLRRRVTIV